MMTSLSLLWRSSGIVQLDSGLATCVDKVVVILFTNYSANGPVTMALERPAGCERAVRALGSVIVVSIDIVSGSVDEIVREFSCCRCEEFPPRVVSKAKTLSVSTTQRVAFPMADGRSKEFFIGVSGSFRPSV
jgi:hypothetical protein